MRALNLVFFFAISIALGGCSKSQAPSAVNKICPIMGNPVKASGGSVTWKVSKVGFCCPQCIDDWNALSESNKTSKLANASK